MLIPWDVDEDASEQEKKIVSRDCDLRLLGGYTGERGVGTSHCEVH